MKLPRIMIAAPKSGSGKTLITCALLKALRKRELCVWSHKCGPDYIDPLFHKEVLGVPSGNLDCFFSEEQQIRELFGAGKNEEEFSVVEGVMGLYDGLGGISEEASTYHLSRILKLPIILVVDVKGMGRSVLPLLAGFLQYDREHLIQGVILNRAGKMLHDLLKPLIEAELSLPVLGYFPEKKELAFESRHLGLVLPGEMSRLENQVEQAAELLEECVDVDRVLTIGRCAENLDDWVGNTKQIDIAAVPVLAEPGEMVAEHIKLGVAQDEAFCFYYQANLKCFEKLGVEIVPFSPIHDKELPKGISGILLGGGYPELWAEALAANMSMRESVAAAISGGMPSLAECGGFMYLHEQLTTQDGKSYPMCGVIPGSCAYQGKLVRFGYIELAEKGSLFLPTGEKIKGHEFHYFDSTMNGQDCVASKPTGGRSYDCVHVDANHWWGFAHLYYGSNVKFVEHFVEEIRKYKNCQFDKNMS